VNEKIIEKDQMGCNLIL